MHQFTAGLQEAKPDDKEPLTKAIVFSQLWTHIQLTGTQLRGQGVSVVLFTSNLKPQERAANLQKFKVHRSRNGCLVCACLLWVLGYDHISQAFRAILFWPHGRCLIMMHSFGSMLSLGVCYHCASLRLCAEWLCCHSESRI